MANINKHLIFNLSAITQRILVNVLTAAEGVKSTGNWQLATKGAQTKTKNQLEKRQILVQQQKYEHVLEVGVT